MKRFYLPLYHLFPGLLFLLVWQVYVSGDRQREFLFASPALIFEAASQEFHQAPFWIDVVTTVFEALCGLFIGTLCGSLFGFLLWVRPGLACLVRPYLVFLGSIPIFAIAPMFIIWFGTGIFAKCITSACGVFFIALHQAYEGAENCSSTLTIYLRGLGVSSMTILSKVILPGTFRSILSGLRLNIGFAFLGAFVGEFVSSEAGLGHYILRASSLYDMPRVLLGVGVLAAATLCLNFLFVSLSRVQRLQ